MKLQTKTLLLIGATTLILLALIYGISQTVILGAFSRQEKLDARENVERVVNAMGRNLAQMKTNVTDWSHWDDTYAFAQDHNDTYAKTNLIDSTFTTLGLNVLIFLDDSGRSVLEKGYDLQNDVPAPVPDGLLRYATRDALMKGYPALETQVTGIVSLPEGPMMVASSAILTGHNEGPPRGMLLFGRYPDAQTVMHLADTTLFSVQAFPPDGPGAPSDVRAALGAVDPEKGIAVHPLSGDSMGGYALVKDLLGAPALVFKVELPRGLYHEGVATTHYMLYSLMAAGLVYALVVLLLFRQLVMARLGSLRDQVLDVGKVGDPSRRVSLTGADELSDLSLAVNNMLGSLERAQEELARSEESLRSILENAPDLIMTWSPAGDIQSVNRASTAAGHTVSEVVGRSAFDFIDPAYHEALRTALKEVFENGKTEGLEVLAAAKDGSPAWYFLRFGAVATRAQAASITVIATDITGRKEMEEALASSQASFRSLLENAPEFITTWSLDGTILTTNRSASGRPTSEIVGTKVFDLTPPEDHDAIRAAIQRVTETGNAENLEFRGRGTDQARHRYQSRVWPIKRNGRVAALTVISTDVSDRQRAAEALRVSEERNRAILDAIPDLLFRMKRDGTYLDFKAKESDLFVPPSVFLGRTVLDILPADMAARSMEAIEAALATAKTQAVEYRLPINGEDRDYEARIAASGSEEVVVLVRDITERKRSEEAILESARQKQLAYEQALIYSMELRREIGDRRKAERELKDLSRRLVEVSEAERRHIARELHDEIGQVLTGLKMALEANTNGNKEGLVLVNQLMDQVHDLSLELRPAILDDAGLLPALLWHIERFSAQTKIKVDFQHRGIGRRFPTEVETAAYRMAQEALTNIARHAKVDTAKLHIWVTGRRLTVRVEDNGVGFDPAAVLATRSSSGVSGMKERVTLLGGTLSVESSPGKGTRLTAELPFRNNKSRRRGDRESNP